MYRLHIWLMLSSREIYRYVHLTVIDTKNIITYTPYVLHVKQRYADISQCINSWHIKRVCLQIKRIFIFLSAVFLLCQTPTLYLPHLKFHGIFNNSLGIFSNKLCPPLQHQTLCKCIAATIKKAHCVSSVVSWREKKSNQPK